MGVAAQQQNVMQKKNLDSKEKKNINGKAYQSGGG